MTIILYGGHKVMGTLFAGKPVTLICGGNLLLATWEADIRDDPGGKDFPERGYSRTKLIPVSEYVRMRMEWPSLADYNTYVYASVYSSRMWFLGRAFTIARGPVPAGGETFTLPKNAAFLRVCAPTELKDAIRLYTL